MLAIPNVKIISLCQSLHPAKLEKNCSIIQANFLKLLSAGSPTTFQLPSRYQIFLIKHEKLSLFKWNPCFPGNNIISAPSVTVWMAVGSETHDKLISIFNTRISICYRKISCIISLQSSYIHHLSKNVTDSYKRSQRQEHEKTTTSLTLCFSEEPHSLNYTKK